MRTVGVIVEYNPLHNGHVYHFQQSKIVSGADAAVAVMSGHFLQRGEPAVVDKWARAEMALEMGADLVLELPVAFSSQPAEWFAYGAVSALDATGVVDALCFGSESGELAGLRRLAAALCEEAEPLRERIRRELGRGVSYPKAYGAAVGGYLEEYLPEVGAMNPGEELAKPNNTLGLHYLIALQRLGSRIEPLTILRVKAGYDQPDITDASIASATAIRRLLFEERSLKAARPYFPEATYRILRREWEAGRAPVGWESFARPLLTALLRETPAGLAQYAEVTEGLEHRLLQSLAGIDYSRDGWFEQLLAGAKTKRYTRTKLQRTLLRILLGHRKPDLAPERVLRPGVPYLRVLGFSAAGRELLRRMKRTARVPVVSKVTRVDSPLLEMDIRATGLYAVAYDRPAPELLRRDYYQSPIRRD